MSENMKKIEQILKEVVKVEELKPETELREIGLDSIDLVEVMMRLEEEFNIEFTNDEMLSLKTVGDVQKTIEKKLAK
ncbi:MAG: acyl carrier protein [Bacilli bacterium]|jgi:acyl carrier protein